MKQRGKKGKKLHLKASVHKWDTDEHLEGSNTWKKTNLCFSSSAKNLTWSEGMTLKIGSGREPFKGCVWQWFITKWKAFQGGPKGSALNPILFKNYLNDKVERISLFSLLFSNTSTLLDKIKIQNDQKIAEMVRITCSQGVSREQGVNWQWKMQPK